MKKRGGKVHLRTGRQPPTPMPSLILKPPRKSSSSPRQNTASPPQAAFTFSAPPPQSIQQNAFTTTTYEQSPAFSPITPHAAPLLPVPARRDDSSRVVPPSADVPIMAANEQQPPAARSAIAPAEYMPQPPPQPFSNEDSLDAIALRAAISALQFQKKKAQEDIRSLETMKKAAVEHPRRFKEALVAGRLREQRPQFGGLQALLDAAESDSEEEGVEDQGHAAGVSEERASDEVMDDGSSRPREAEVPDSQPSRPTTASSSKGQPTWQDPPPDFSRMPGAQPVVRMPHINWEKYHIVGEGLDQLHEQQRRWPGSTFAYGQERGREYSVAAPYSPFYDTVGGQGQGAGHGRKDSVATSNALPTPTGTVSEHPMETRRSSKYQQH